MCLVAVVLVSLSTAASAAEPDDAVTVEDGGVSFELKQADSGRSLLMISRGKQIVVGHCSEESVTAVEDPASDHKASVVVRNCGATTDFATHVVLTNSVGLSKSIAVYAGKPQIDVSWNGGTLQISRPLLSSQAVFVESIEASGVPVTYTESRGAKGTTAPQVLEYSSFNYGATGRAAGISKELLLRWAGWSQMASGLHRHEWGSWSGSPPYGDDPSGSMAILRGTQYFETRFKK